MEKAPSTQPVTLKQVGIVAAWMASIFINFVALFLGIIFAGIAMTEGSPAQEAQDYVPLWACVFMTTIGATVPAFTAVVATRTLLRRARERRALASDKPEPLPENSL